MNGNSLSRGAALRPNKCSALRCFLWLTPLGKRPSQPVKSFCRSECDTTFSSECELRSQQTFSQLKRRSQDSFHFCFSVVILLQEKSCSNVIYACDMQDQGFSDKLRSVHAGVGGLRCVGALGGSAKRRRHFPAMVDTKHERDLSSRHRDRIELV